MKIGYILESDAKKKGFHGNIEQLTLENDNYRKVLYSGDYLQLVVMSIKPGESIGVETHGNDQFIRVEDGSCQVIINNSRYNLEKDHVVIIPAGSRHDVKNTGDKPLKLYTIYGPPKHKDGTVEPEKSESEPFDGTITES